MRVLVLDDDTRIAERLVAHLGRQGHALDIAASLAAGGRCAAARAGAASRNCRTARWS
jgi:DNA-binding response OmpR family regulator